MFNFLVSIEFSCMLLLIAIDIDHRKAEIPPRDKRKAHKFEPKIEEKFVEVFNIQKTRKERLFLLRVLTKYLQFQWTPFQILIKECKISVSKNFISYRWHFLLFQQCHLFQSNFKIVFSGNCSNI